MSVLVWVVAVFMATGGAGLIVGGAVGTWRSKGGPANQERFINFRHMIWAGVSLLGGGFIAHPAAGALGMLT